MQSSYEVTDGIKYSCRIITDVLIASTHIGEMFLGHMTSDQIHNISGLLGFINSKTQTFVRSRENFLASCQCGEREFQIGFQEEFIRASFLLLAVQPSRVPTFNQSCSTILERNSEVVDSATKVL